MAGVKVIDVIEEGQKLAQIRITLKTGEVSFHPIRGPFKISKGKMEFGGTTDTEVRTTLLIN